MNLAQFREYFAEDSGRYDLLGDDGDLSHPMDRWILEGMKFLIQQENSLVSDVTIVVEEEEASDITNFTGGLPTVLKIRVNETVYEITNIVDIDSIITSPDPKRRALEVLNLIPAISTLPMSAKYHIVGNDTFGSLQGSFVLPASGIERIVTDEMDEGFYTAMEATPPGCSVPFEGLSFYLPIEIQGEYVDAFIEKLINDVWSFSFKTSYYTEETETFLNHVTNFSARKYTSSSASTGSYMIHTFIVGRDGVPVGRYIVLRGAINNSDGTPSGNALMPSFISTILEANELAQGNFVSLPSGITHMRLYDGVFKNISDARYTFTLESMNSEGIFGTYYIGSESYIPEFNNELPGQPDISNYEVFFSFRCQTYAIAITDINSILAEYFIDEYHYMLSLAILYKLEIIGRNRAGAEEYLAALNTELRAYRTNRANANPVTHFSMGDLI